MNDNYRFFQHSFMGAMLFGVNKFSLVGQNVYLRATKRK